MFGIGPVEAANQALERAGIGWGDVDVVELNEAFAAQSLACLARVAELDPEIVNVQRRRDRDRPPARRSGARILGTLAHELRGAAAATGVAAICIGVGQGLAVVLEA